MNSLKAKGLSILRWSEKYTKTDMVYLFKNSFWVFFSQLVTTISAFMVLVVITNVLSKEELGNYRFLLSLISIFAIFSLPGFNIATTRSAAKEDFVELEWISKTRIRFSTIAALMSFVTGIYFYFTEAQVLGLLFCISAPFLLFYNSFFHFYYFLQGKEEFSKASLYQIFSRLIYLVGMFAAIFFYPEVWFLVVAFFVTTIFGHYYGYKSIRNVYAQDSLSVNRHQQRSQLLRYSIYLSVISFPALLASQVDKIIIGHFMSPEMLAIYFVGIMLPMESARVGRILAQVALPRFSKRSVNQGLALLIKILKLEAILLLCWLIYAFFSPYMFELFFPDYLNTAALQISIFGMLILLTTPTYIIRSLLFAEERKKELNVLLIIVPILHIVFLVPLTYLYGIFGALLAFLFAGFLDMLLSSIILIQKKSVSTPKK